MRGWCGNCFVSKELREIFLIVVIGGFHMVYCIFSILWFVSYSNVKKDSDFKANYTGDIHISTVEDYLFVQAILTSVILAIGTLSLINAFNDMMHGWFMYSMFKGLRFATVSITIILYTIDMILWNSIEAYAPNASFFKDQVPQIMTLVGMAGFMGVTHLTDQMNVMYLQNSYDLVGNPDPTKTRSRFYGSKYRA